MANEQVLERWVNAGGIKTHYVTAGEGDPVILLHGGGAGAFALHNWAPTIPALAAAGFSVYAPDVVGFGLTDKPVGWHTHEKKVEHLKYFIDALCLDRVHLVGNSMGAGISCGFIVKYPEQVMKMTLMGGGAVRLGKLTPSLQGIQKFTPSREKMRSILESLTARPELVTDAMVESRYQMSILPGAQEANSAFLADLPFEEFLTSTEKKLETTPHPVLLVWGEEDHVVPLPLGERLHEVLPNSRLEVFPNCGHWTQLEEPEGFSNTLIEFFSEKE